MTPLYLYRDSDQLPLPTATDRADDAARSDYGQRCVHALEAAARDEEAFVTTTADWRGYLTLASMFDTSTSLTRLVATALAASASSASIDESVAMALAEAWFRAYESGPLVPSLNPGAPRPVAMTTGHPRADAEYQLVLDAVFHASEPRHRERLRDLERFADGGAFLLDADPGASALREAPAGP